MCVCVCVCVCVCARVCVCVCVCGGGVHWWLSGIHSELPIERLVVQGSASRPWHKMLKIFPIMLCFTAH